MLPIEEIYKPFGPEVVCEVRRQLKVQGNLSALLQKLNEPALPALDKQHEALRHFIFRYGTAVFLQVAQSDLPPQEIERLKIARISRDSTDKPSTKSDLAQHIEQPAPTSPGPEWPSVNPGPSPQMASVSHMPALSLMPQIPQPPPQQQPQHPVPVAAPAGAAVRPTLPIALAIVIAENTEPEIYEGIATDINEHSLVIVVSKPISETGFRALLSKKCRCYVSFKGHPDLPDTVTGIGRIAWSQSAGPNAGEFCNIEVALREVEENDLRMIREYAEKIPPPPVLPPSVDDSFREDSLSSSLVRPSSSEQSGAYLDGVVEENVEDTAKAKPRTVVVSVPVFFAMSFPEVTNTPIVRQGTLISLNDRGMLLESVLAPMECRAIQQRKRRCCIQIKDFPELPEAINGTTVSIQARGKDSKTIYHVGLVFSHMPEEARRRITDFIDKRSGTVNTGEPYTRNTSTDLPTSSRLPTPRPRRSQLFLPVTMVIDSAQPNGQSVYPATIGNLNERGAMAQVDLEQETYRDLLQGNQPATVWFGRLEGDLPASLSGKIVWIQPQQLHGHTSYNLGISFDNVTEAIANQIRTFVTNAAEQSLVPEVSWEAIQSAISSFDRSDGSHTAPPIPQPPPGREPSVQFETTRSRPAGEDTLSRIERTRSETTQTTQSMSPKSKPGLGREENGSTGMKPNPKVSDNAPAYRTNPNNLVPILPPPPKPNYTLIVMIVVAVLLVANLVYFIFFSAKATPQRGTPTGPAPISINPGKPELQPTTGRNSSYPSPLISASRDGQTIYITEFDGTSYHTSAYEQK